jgi:hypothetical protein
MRMRALATTTLLAGFVATACYKMPPAVASAPVPTGHFAVILEHSATGWAAHCEAGCQWTDVSMSCAGCDVRLDASGIARAYPAAPAATGFAFVLSNTGRGWTARGIQGVRWQSLSWSCGAAVCRARVDESGVGRP